MIKKITTLALVPFMITTLTMAEDDYISSSGADTDKPFTIGLKAGTLGVGVDVSKPITKNVSLRINANGFSYNRTGTQEDIQYDADVELSNVGFIADYYPYETTPFKISAGVYYNGNTANAKGIPSSGGTYTIDGIDYKASEIGSIDGSVEFQEVAPYLGIGWGEQSTEKGFGFSIDVGAMTGNPEANLVATRGTVNDAIWRSIEESVQNEENTLNDDLSDYGIYPVIMVGFTYTF